MPYTSDSSMPLTQEPVPETQTAYTSDASLPIPQPETGTPYVPPSDLPFPVEPTSETQTSSVYPEAYEAKQLEHAKKCRIRRERRKAHSGHQYSSTDQASKEQLPPVEETSSLPAVSEPAELPPTTYEQTPPPTEYQVPVQESQPAPADQPAPVQQPVPADQPAPVEHPVPENKPAPVEQPVPENKPAPVNPGDPSGYIGFLPGGSITAEKTNEQPPSSSPSSSSSAMASSTSAPAASVSVTVTSSTTAAATPSSSPSPSSDTKATGASDTFAPPAGMSSVLDTGVGGIQKDVAGAETMKEGIAKGIKAVLPNDDSAVSLAIASACGETSMGQNMPTEAEQASDKVQKLGTIAQEFGPMRMSRDMLQRLNYSEAQMAELNSKTPQGNFLAGESFAKGLVEYGFEGFMIFHRLGMTGYDQYLKGAMTDASKKDSDNFITKYQSLQVTIESQNLKTGNDIAYFKIESAPHQTVGAGPLEAQ